MRQGQIKLQSVSGDVRVGIRPGTRLHIDANSTSGDVSSDLDVKDTPSDTPSGSEARLPGQDRQRRHRDHPGRSRFSLR